MSIKKHEHFAAAIVGFAFSLGAIQYAIVKYAAPQVSSIMVVYVLYLGGFLCYSPLIIRSKFRILKPNKRSLLLILRAWAGLGLWFGLYWSLKYIPLVDATLLANLAPVWVPILLLILFKTPIKKRLLVGIAVGFIGCAFILKPDRQVFEWAALIAVAAGFFKATTLVAIKELMKSEKSSTIVIYYFMVNAICLTPFAIIYWSMPNVTVLLLLIGNAVLMVIHQELLNYGFHIGNASKLSVLTYLAVLFTALLGWYYWQEIPDIWTIIGGILIIVGGIYVLRLRALTSGS